MNFHASVFILLSVVYCASADKVFKIENGQVSGEENESFVAIRGLPYAESPVGELRFAAPQPFMRRWGGVRPFKNFSDVCAQYHHFGYSFEGSEENCLTVNVYVPNKVLESKETAPVIFYIHGGAFMFGGSNDYGPENIMKSQNMILVTVNYRLGILGFLSTEDDVIPGNFGLKDQVMALKWVQRNIKAFNGDSNKVTITGFSAGGASVHLHYMSPLSNGLFKNGISHSGNALDPWVVMESAQVKAHQVADFMNCPKVHKELLKCLREKPAEDLVMLAKKFQPFMYNPYSPFGVVVEKSHKGAFLIETPFNLLYMGNFQKLPWLLSQAQDEGLYPGAEFYNDETLKQLNDKWHELAPFILDYDGITKNANRKDQLARKIRRHYLGYSEISKANFRSFVDILSDRLFKHGAYKAINLMSKFTPCFFYYFRYKATNGVVELNGVEDDIGIPHGEDVFLIYESETIRKLPYSDADKLVTKNLVDLYFSFVNDNKAVYGGQEIEQSKPNAVKCLEISTKAEMIELDEHFGSVPFWDDIESTLNYETRTRYDEL